MRPARRVLIFVLALAGGSTAPAFAQTQITTPNISTVPGPVTVTFGGQTFVNTGLVGMGRIPAGTRDFLNDTLGAFSGMEINLATWRRTANGYTGALFGLPDRGPNGIGNVTFSDYAGRLNSYSMLFNPYTGSANLPASTGSQNQLVLTQTGGFTFRDFNGNGTTGYEPGQGALGIITQRGIDLPGGSGPGTGKIALDAEGLRFLRDGTFYVSDEYGSNVYYFDAQGRLQGVIRPPAALLPRDAAGQLTYSSVDPVTGRRNNQGIEGLAVTPDGRKLVTLAQSATLQDSTGNQQDRTNTRLMIYDISSSRTPSAPIADYILQLPVFTQSGNGGAPNRTAAQSEILALNDTQFLVLSRDGNGLGTATGNYIFKSVLLVDTSGATNIAGTPFETSTTPVSPSGRLNSSVVPVRQVELVNMLNATQLEKFGGNLNNITPNRLTLGEKWEGMTLAPVLDESAPQDFFLFVGNDNDFLSTTCQVNGEDCSQSVDSDTHVMIFRLTLPTYVDPEYRAAMVAGGPMMLEMLGASAGAVAGVHLDNVLAHLDAARRTGVASKGFSTWGSGIATQHDGFQGAIGLDYGFTARISAGITLGIGGAEPETDGFKARIGANSYGATFRYTDSRVFANAAYAHNAFDADNLTRPAAYGLSGVGNTDGSGHSVALRGGLKIDAPLAALTPFVEYRYVRATFDAYTEAGAAGGNTQYPEYGMSTHAAAVGAEAQWTWRGMVPLVHAAFHGESSDPRDVTLTLASAKAAMASETVAVGGADDRFGSVGFGIERAIRRGFWHVGYTVEVGRHDRTSNVVTGGLSFSF